MRTKSENINAWWDPYATSTPLKKIPNQSEVKNKEQKQLATLTDSVSILKKLQNACNTSEILRDKSTGTKLPVSKRTKKNRISAFFDLSSSSSDEESETKKRPIIKISSKKNDKVSLKSKEPENEETSVANVSTGGKPNLRNISVKNNEADIHTVDTSKCKDSQIQSKKNKAQAEIDACFKENCIDSDEENKIFNERTKTKKKSKPSSKKVNSVKCLKGSLNSRHPSEFSEFERKNLQTVQKPSQGLLKPKPIEGNTCQDSQGLSYQKANIESNKSPKLRKRKTKKAVDSAGPVKKRTRKAINVKTPTLKTVVSAVKSHCISQDKSNLSHQLFSESTEQEYINTLDLASDETSKAPENTVCSLQAGNNSVFEPFIWPYPGSHKVCTESKSKEERPKRKQQVPLEFWMPKAQLTDVNKDAECQEPSEKDNDQNQETKLLPPSEETRKKLGSKKTCEVENPSLKTQKVENKKTELANMVEKKAVSDNPLNKNLINQNLKNGVLNCLGLSAEMSVSNQKNKGHLKDSLKHMENKNMVNSSENPVFKKSDDLVFNWNGSGCSVVPCWNGNAFKCGVFKLKVKSQFTCRTLHSNSHWGGVLVKGNLRMKIGMREQDLKEGDMAFVPPLTEWQATNTGECESVFYYWCGRFES